MTSLPKLSRAVTLIWMTPTKFAGGSPKNWPCAGSNRSHEGSFPPSSLETCNAHDGITLRMPERAGRNAEAPGSGRYIELVGERMRQRKRRLADRG